MPALLRPPAEHSTALRQQARCRRRRRRRLRRHRHHHRQCHRHHRVSSRCPAPAAQDNPHRCNHQRGLTAATTHRSGGVAVSGVGSLRRPPAGGRCPPAAGPGRGGRGHSLSLDNEFGPNGLGSDQVGPERQSLGRSESIRTAGLRSHASSAAMQPAGAPGGTQTSRKGVVPPRTDDIYRSAHCWRSLPALAVSSDPWFAPVARPGRVPRPRYSTALRSCCAGAPAAARPAARRSGWESGGRWCRNRNRSKNRV